MTRPANWTNKEADVTGVYMLFLHEQLVYVGRSTDCHRRVQEHRANGRTFDHYTVTKTSEKDAAWIERALIGAMNPDDNAMLRSMPKPAVLPEVEPSETGKTKRPSPYFVSGDEVDRLFGISTATRHRWVSRGLLPSPVRFPNGRNVGWRRTDIDAALLRVLSGEYELCR